MHRIGRALVLCAILVTSACAVAPGTGEVRAAVAQRTVRPAPRQLREVFDRGLSIHLAPEVQDHVEQAPAPGMHLQVDSFRATLGDALELTFGGNFTAVAVEAAETRQGLELVVLKAAIQPTGTISYQAVLMLDGVEIANLAGDTAGRSIATGPAGYQQAMETLIDEAVAKTCEGLFEQVFFGEGSLARIERIRTSAADEKAR